MMSVANPPELRPMPDGVFELWFAGDLIGEIQLVDGGLRLVLGDYDPASTVVWHWNGGPVTVNIQLPAGGKSR